MCVMKEIKELGGLKSGAWVTGRVVCVKVRIMWGRARLGGRGRELDL